jgi:hypothetical protein
MDSEIVCFGPRVSTWLRRPLDPDLHIAAFQLKLSDVLFN